MTAFVTVQQAQERLEELIEEVVRTGKSIPILGDGRVQGWLSPELDDDAHPPLPDPSTR